MGTPFFTLLLLSLLGSSHSQTIHCQESSSCVCPPTSATETCTLTCDKTDVCKESSLTCRAGDPCIIKCTATTSCAAGTTINANASTDVTIICSAKDSCKDSMDIFCGTGDCQLQCNHPDACLDFGSIDVSLSHTFQCVGHCPKSPNYIPPPFAPPTNSPTPAPTLPTFHPTPAPTSMPTASPIPVPTLSPTYPYIQPTNAPFTYQVINPNTDDNTDKDFSETQNGILNLFDTLVWVLMTVGICVVCIVFMCLYRVLCKKRRKSIRQAAHKRTISTSVSNNLIEDKNEEWRHRKPSMELEWKRSKTPVSPIDGIGMETKEDNANGEMQSAEQSSFTIDTEQQKFGDNANSVSEFRRHVPFNQSESGIDYCSGNTAGNNGESMIKPVDHLRVPLKTLESEPADDIELETIQRHNSDAASVI